MEQTIHRQETLLNGAGQEGKGALNAIQKQLEQKTAEWDSSQAQHKEDAEAWEYERLELQNQVHLAQSSLARVNADLVSAKHSLGRQEARIQQLEYAPL